MEVNIGTSHSQSLALFSTAACQALPACLALTCEARMAERKVDWGRQASYCRLQAKIGKCSIVDLIATEWSEVITG